MDRCWFILGQKHYPPPQNGKGPIQLGHLIRDLKHLDQVVNNDPGPHPFPQGMVVYPSRLEDLKWVSNHGHTVGGSANALVPFPQVADLISAGGEAGAEFRKSTSNFWHFEALDTLLIQPTTSYIEDSVKDKLVNAYTQKKKSILNTWSLFMITGLAMARATRGAQAEEKGWGVHGGPTCNSLAGIAEAGVDVSLNKANEEAVSFRKSSDFIWAVQVTKISKHMLYSELDVETYTKGATYADEDEDVEDMLVEEGINPQSINIAGDDVFVLPSEDNEDLTSEVE